MARGQRCRYTVIDQESGSVLGTFTCAGGFTGIGLDALVSGERVYRLELVLDKRAVRETK
jgi:hypothetical protein